ncbi:hypothetical protein [Rubritalea tangerina]|uniref:hypothetical protein n=1 Tax=Rubritalea tangerina TaxID=430798 RepID=UPI0036127006
MVGSIEWFLGGVDKLLHHPFLDRVIWSQLPCGKGIWEAEASFVSGFVVFQCEDVYPRHEIRLARCKIYSQRAANHFVHTAKKGGVWKVAFSVFAWKEKMGVASVCGGRKPRG